MKETREGLNLFQQALVDAINERADKILEQEPEEPVYSERHLRIMKKILSGEDPRLQKSPTKEESEGV